MKRHGKYPHTQHILNRNFMQMSRILKVIAQILKRFVIGFTKHLRLFDPFMIKSN